MKSETAAKITAAIAALGAIAVAWKAVAGDVLPFLDWLALNARIVWAVDFFRHGVAAIGFGTVVGLFVPYLLDGVPSWHSLPAWRTQMWLRALTFATTFVVGVFLNDSRAGVVTSFGFAFGGPFVTMSLWRLLSRFPCFRPRALEPTIGEAQNQLSRAIEATKKPDPLPVINPSES